MRKLVVMRGLPGSGKSTKAQALIDEVVAKDPGAKVALCSADQFFTNLTTGEYKFDPKLLGRAHETCAHRAALSMEAGCVLVVIDNTNTTKWEYSRYLDMAKYYGYEVEVCMVGNLTDLDLYAARNTHRVPLAAIQKMAKRFEF